MSIVPHPAHWVTCRCCRRMYPGRWRVINPDGSWYVKVTPCPYCGCQN